MLPFVTNITCLTGDFEGTYDCRNEAFLKAGTPNTPQGAIGAIGTATGKTHTCFNNIVSAGIFDGIFNHEIYYMGGALAFGKYILYESYPGNPANHVVQFSYWNNLMGDPGLELWTGVPENLNISYNSTIPLGSDQIEISVTNDLGESVENAWVTILKDETDLFSNEFTDNEGIVYLPIASGVTGAVKITASKHNFIPVQDFFIIGETNVFVNTEIMIIDDDSNGLSSGNGDSEIGSNETIEAFLTLYNYGSNTTSNLTISISSEYDFITFQESSVNTSFILPNSELITDEPLVFTVDPNIIGGTEVFFDINISDANGNNWQKRISKIIHDSNIIFSSYEVVGENNYNK
ncbi:MAG: hypothetical protein K8S23_07230 [Candidatus Cloacimonetes bacterium]|nr:hypothetical protein [Candidatus Cloacimonadota bacterium]